MPATRCVGHEGHDMAVAANVAGQHAGHDMAAMGGEHGGHDRAGGHEGHGAHVDHTGHEQMFRQRFWVSLVLSIPVLLYSPTIQKWLGFTMPVL